MRAKILDKTERETNRYIYLKELPDGYRKPFIAKRPGAETYVYFPVNTEPGPSPRKEPVRFICFSVVGREASKTARMLSLESCCGEFSATLDQIKKEYGPSELLYEGEITLTLTEKGIAKEARL